MLNIFITALRDSQLVIAISHFFAGNEAPQVVTKRETIARSAVIFDASEHRSELLSNGITLAI